MAVPSRASEPKNDRRQAAIVVSKAVVRAAQTLGISNACLARTLGISSASASRLRDGIYIIPADSKPYELALLLIRLFRSIDAMMGGEEDSVRSWMASPNTALKDAPIRLITSVTGLVNAVNYVDVARARL